MKINFFVKTQGFFLKNFPLISTITLFFYLLPFIIFQENSIITIHDNLDSVVPWIKALTNSGKVFALNPYTPIYQIMNGIPRGCMLTGFNVYVWLFMIFKPFTAYLINDMLIHIAAFSGMIFLLRNHIIPKKNNVIIFGVALCFSILPFYSIFGLSIAGQPLLLNSFLNILKKKDRWWDYIYIIIFPFYSFLAFIGPFIISALILIFFTDIYRKKAINMRFLIFLLVLTTLYIVAEYNLLSISIFQKDLILHRTEFNPDSRSLNFTASFKRAKGIFFSGQYHAASLPKFIITIFPLALIISIVKRKLPRYLLMLILVSITISLFYGCWKYSGFSQLKSTIILLKMFQFDRFHFLLPLIWYLIMAISLYSISKIKFGNTFCLILIFIQMFFVLGSNTERIDTIKRNLFGRNADSISYTQFFSEDLFNQIGEFINLPKEDYRIVNIGIHPTVAQYNGFYTLDGYQGLYPLKYKHKFRKIMEKELDKNEKWRRYYDSWGNRCYLFVAELDKLQYYKHSDISINDLQINSEALKEMNCTYLFSTLEIKNYKENNLLYIKTFSNVESPWVI